jgi:D-alanyl-D-alanine endopeptidase (penicillin-binding protein 7)
MVWKNIKFAVIAVGIIVSLVGPLSARAAVGPYLKTLYATRADLQGLFEAENFLTKAAAATELTGLEDWARQYGWREDKKLEFYKPKGVIPVSKNAVAAPDTGALGYIVVDDATGLILAQKNAGKVFPIASLTKLATVDAVLSLNVPLTRVSTITADDQVGGSRLGVAIGTKVSVNDLLYAALLPSANDAANALADATNLSRKKFVSLMNKRAQSLQLSRTKFVEPSGIDDANVSTPREFAIFASTVFNRDKVRSVATTAARGIKFVNSGKKMTIKNGNRLLTYPQYDDVYVFAGKTGYLGPENGCNLAVGLKSPNGSARPLIVVLFGENTMTGTMDDAHALAKWAWGKYKW